MKSNKKFSIPVFVVLMKYRYEDDEQAQLLFHSFGFADVLDDIERRKGIYEKEFGSSAREITCYEDNDYDRFYEIGDYYLWTEERSIEI